MPIHQETYDWAGVTSAEPVCFYGRSLYSVAGFCQIIATAQRVAMSPKPVTDNTLFCDGSLLILREHFPTESVDLAYPAPHFNSNCSYNTLPKDKT
jgi:hypothetical protein